MSTVAFDAHTTTEDWYASSYEALQSIGGTAADTEPAAGVGNVGDLRQTGTPRNDSVNYGISSLGPTSFSRYQFAYQRSENNSPTVLISHNALSSTKCKAVITGRYRINASAFAGTTNGNFPHILPLYIWYYDNSGTKYLLQENITITGQTINIVLAPSANNNVAAVAPTYASGGTNIPEVSFTVRGNNTAAGALNQLVYLKLDVDSSQPTTTPGGPDGTNYDSSPNPQVDGWRGTTLRWRPIDNPLGATVDKPFFYGTITRTWEANQYIIDGSGGDTKPSIVGNFSLSAIARLTYVTNSQAALVGNFTVQEQSQSVITGVEETLQNNFTLSVTGQVKYGISKTLTQATELLGTTFNFRFMDPVTISADHTSTIFGNINRGLGSPLTLSADTTSTQTAGLIYDVATDYTWDDFSIVGYFITGYTLRGYATDSAEYAWTDLATDPWDAWTYSSWQGLETGWDQWPEDLWNSSKKISFDFDMAQAANIIRSGVGQLLSTTSLTDTSAKLKSGASTVRSDFLCDGSPSGKIGGGALVIPNITTDFLVNYIINNAQNVNGAFNATLLGNYIAKFLWSVSSDFSLTTSPTFKPGGVTNAQCITMVNALAKAIYGPSPTLQGAFDPIFTARMFIGTDPYLIHKLLQETRQIFVDAESRGIQIAEEIRLNSIPAEDRDHLVPQETRSMKLRIPPMTNRFSTPKVRTE